MTKIAVLGARGRLGRVVAKAFLDAGYEVRAVTRDGKLPAEFSGAEAVVADALDRQSLIRATQGADIVFNGLNPIYSDWSTVLPMAENVMAACHANRALHLFPGTVYNFGSPMPAVITEETPQRPTTEKGRIRVAMEELFRREAAAGRVRTVLLRAGDFFGGKGTGSWFDLVVASSSPRMSTPRRGRSIWCMSGHICRTLRPPSSPWPTSGTCLAPMRTLTCPATR
jgi:nucleoside-diphosphate-sugar epimerase